ncbi:RNA-directed DNA polymerase [Sphingomonas sanguinis]|uniref:RNA-directed DNA polymerase n=1 Tax=Sphingomonas sanguinis TaxID=33051 RepID=UPI001C562DD5|nr:RNA-directed DNA polymerase [Sphingomonas sanguinis]QXT34843.1 RNA-directed DNA polymerase [Sphingomonas sanguinis]
MAEREIRNRYGLLQKGLFPEVLPPCFVSTDLKRALSGLVRTLKGRAFQAKRHSDYIRYSGTKHDGSRRYYGTPNPISYFHVASFIADHWGEFAARFDSSPFSVSRPKVGREDDDRPIIMQSLSELTTVASRKLRYAGHVLRTDVAQFFPSVYSHAIVWSAHGIREAKADTSPRSAANTFNALDLFVRNCQMGESQGLLVGPDAFRLIAEFVMAGLDAELKAGFGTAVVGAARHVDDYYLGLSSEAEALVALSTLRDTLQRYSLNVNDGKTYVMRGVEPLNEIWAQELRQNARGMGGWLGDPDTEDLVLFVNKALQIAREIKSDSPVKIALRTLDQIRSYGGPDWDTIEPYLQRIMFHHPHAIDYVALLVVKRVADGGAIDRDGWREASYNLIHRHLAFNHHHEVVWLLWLLFTAELEVTEQLATACCGNPNAHIRALIVAAHGAKRLARKPPIRFRAAKLASNDGDWLLNLVARSTGFTGMAFGGTLAEEMEHLASRRVKLIDFKAHVSAVRGGRADAISRTRYGYDSEGKSKRRRSDASDEDGDVFPNAYDVDFDELI